MPLETIHMKTICTVKGFAENERMQLVKRHSWLKCKRQFIFWVVVLKKKWLVYGNEMYSIKQIQVRIECQSGDVTISFSEIMNFAQILGRAYLENRSDTKDSSVRHRTAEIWALEVSTALS